MDLFYFALFGERELLVFLYIFCKLRTFGVRGWLFSKEAMGHSGIVFSSFGLLFFFVFLASGVSSL